MSEQQPNVNLLEGVYNPLESPEAQGVSKEALAFGLEALEKHLAVNQALGSRAVGLAQTGKSDYELAA